MTAKIKVTTRKIDDTIRQYRAISGIESVLTYLDNYIQGMEQVAAKNPSVLQRTYAQHVIEVLVNRREATEKEYELKNQ